MAERNLSTAKQLNERVQRHPDGTKEYWRDVPGYEGCYRVSSFGRVKSLARFVRHPKGGFKRIRPRMLTPVKVSASGGYESNQVALSKNGKTVTPRIYRLVMLAFVGPCPPGMECCHFPDRNPSNDRLENLRWDTHKNNEADKKKHGTTMKGEKNPNVRLTEKQVRRIKELQGILTKRELCVLFKIGGEHLWLILTGRIWFHVKS